MKIEILDKGTPLERTRFIAETDSDRAVLKELKRLGAAASSGENWAEVINSATVFKIKLSELHRSGDLSTLTFNALQRGGIFTIQDLVNCTEKQLLQLHPFGKKGVAQVKALLDTLGLSLK